MLRTRNVQPSLWESVLPQVCLRLPVELERVDAWLDDERFFAPFVPHFSARMGRPSVPMETYLRLMFLEPLPAWLGVTDPVGQFGSLVL
jgi:IS5 family transposase